MKKLQRIELLKDFIQEAVDRGATSVQAVHEYIADLPFEALEQTGLLTEDKTGLRQKQQQTIGVVYDAIRRINREIGQLISDQFENIEESTEAASRMAPEPPAKPAAPRKATASKAAKKAVKKAAPSKAAAKKKAG
ncbi:hypothetical protein [Nevskia ramosa]|uniref:hypothetical protein n=1 Tax=Nevskia ramosa TaxID=64002 RepID=UPI0003B63C54|nr:hypothetical protein [Nevskia ramosa]